MHVAGNLFFSYSTSISCSVLRKVASKYPRFLSFPLSLSRALQAKVFFGSGVAPLERTSLGRYLLSTH